MVFWCVDIHFANPLLLNIQAVEAWGRGVVFGCFLLFVTVNNSARHPEVDTISNFTNEHKAFPHSLIACPR